MPTPTPIPGNFWETVSFQTAVFLAIFTMFAGICTGAWAVWQRRKDLQWKQAELARTLLDAIFDFKPSNDAWKMVDGETGYYDDVEKVKIFITMDVVRGALQLPWREQFLVADSRKDNYVRWCFDALFYYLERLEQSLQIKVVRFEHLIAPTCYYIELMARDKKLFEEYSRFIGFHGAVSFMNRFPPWRSASVEVVKEV